MKIKKEETMAELIIKGERYQASAFFQILFFCLFGALLLWILYKPVVGFEAYDEPPELVSLTPQQIINFGGSPAFVDVGMYIRDIPVLEMENGKMIADVSVWFLFDPRVVSMEQLEKFSFDTGEVLHKSEPYTRIEGEKLFVRHDMKIKFSLKLDYRSFPLDDHRIRLALTNHFVFPSEVIFLSSRSNLTLNKEVKIQGWRPIEKHVKTGYLMDEIRVFDEKRKVYHPRVVFSFDFARVGFRNIMVILIPLLLIFMVSLFTWTFNPLGRIATSIMPISVMSITAIIAHHFVIERISPKTGYFMISNYIFLLIILFVCLVFLVNVLGRRITGFYKDIIAFMLYAILSGFLLFLTKPLF